MTKNTKVASGAKSRNVQAGNMRNKAGSSYVHQKAPVPKKVKKSMGRPVQHDQLTPDQALLIQEMDAQPGNAHLHKRHRLVDPASQRALHMKLLDEIAHRSKMTGVSADMEGTTLKRKHH